MIRRILILCLFLLLLFPAAGIGAAENEKNLTLMIYMCGSDLESGYSSASMDLEEITKACAGNDNVTVLVMIGGSTRWTGDICLPDETQILEIASRGRRRIMDYPYGMNMGEAETLSAFLRFGTENRPADQYALILWDHGGGPMEGVCFDERCGMDSLSLEELEGALEGSPFSAGHRLAWIGFDACLMAAVETAHSCEYYAEYMVASQETEPDTGWNYAFLKDIGKGESPEEACRRILDAYPRDKKESDLLTLSLVDLRKLEDIDYTLERFFRKISDYLNPDSFRSLSKVRQGVKSFGRASTGSDYDLADLRHLAGEYAFAAPEEAEALQKALDSAVTAVSGNQENAHGLSIFSPYYNKDYYLSKWRQEYRDFDFLPAYQGYLNRYDAIWTDTPDIRWTGLKTAALPLAEAGTQTVELVLTDEQAEHFAEASCTILEDYESEKLYHSIYYVEHAALEGNVLRAEYSFQALYAVDDNGVVETKPIPFIVRDGYYIIYAWLLEQSLIVNHTDLHPLVVMLLCRKNEETQELEIINISPYSEDGLLNYGRQSVQLDPGKWTFIFLDTLIPYEITENRDGSVLPFSQWNISQDYGMIMNLDVIDPQGNRYAPFSQNGFTGSPPEGSHLESEADLTRPWKLKFLPLRASGRDVAAQFTIRDTNGNEWGSDLAYLTPPQLLGSAPVAWEGINRQDVQIRPFAVKALMDGGVLKLCIRVRMHNMTGQQIQVYAVDPAVNGIATQGQDRVLPGYRMLSPGSETVFDFLFDLSEIPVRKIREIRSVSFYPLLMMNEDDHAIPPDLERISIPVELDPGSLPLPQDEPSEPLGRCRVRGISAELLRLEETGPGLFSGEMHLMNDGNAFCLVGFDGEDALFGINEGVIQDCVRIRKCVYLEPGGEAWVPFEIDAGKPAGETGGNTAAGALIIRQILHCGFPVAIVEDIKHSMVPQEDYGDGSYAGNLKFILERPFFLKNPFPAVFFQE